MDVRRRAFGIYLGFISAGKDYIAAWLSQESDRGNEGEYEFIMDGFPNF